MKRISLAFIVFLAISATNSWASPLEFYAEVSAKTPVDSLNTTLTVKVTPLASIDVAVTTRTDFKDTDGNPITIDDIDVGALVEIEATYTSEGFLALEIQLQNESNGFEIKGFLEGVQTDSPQSIEVQGFKILVGPDTRINDEERSPITLEDLDGRLAAAESAGLLVKVEGTYQDEGLLASEIKILPVGDFARISLEGVISNVESETEFTLDIGGGTTVTVNILPMTEIVGDPVAGLYVKVIGQLAADLSVDALKIRVLGLFELSPDELEMDYGQTRTVTVLLRQSLDEDLALQVTTADPAVATVSSDSITIPAGDLSTTFDVTAGETDGKTVVSVSAADAYGGFTRKLEVEVGEDQSGPREVGLRWSPGVVRAAPQGRVTVKLMLKYGVATEDIPVGLTLEESSADLDIRFPDDLVIPQGEKMVDVELLFGSQSGSGKLVATLPDILGGESAELDIELHSNAQAPLKVSWSQKRVEIAPSSEIQIELRLSRVVEEPVSVVITPVSGDSGVLGPYVSAVDVPAGEQVLKWTLKSSEMTGKVRLRAALPLELGGAHDDLDFRVK